MICPAATQTIQTGGVGCLLYQRWPEEAAWKRRQLGIRGTAAAAAVGFLFACCGWRSQHRASAGRGALVFIVTKFSRFVRQPRQLSRFATVVWRVDARAMVSALVLCTRRRVPLPCPILLLLYLI